MGSNKNGVSGAANSNAVNGASPACVPGVVCFLVGSAFGAMAVLHASWLAEVGGEWASAARWAARPAGSIGAHRLLVTISLLFLAASVWRLAKRSAAVEARVGSTDSNRCPDKPVSGSGSQSQSQADREEDDNVGETIDSEEGYVQHLRRRLKKEMKLKTDALDDLDNERSAFFLLMTKNEYLEKGKAQVLQNQEEMIHYLENEKRLVEREAPQSQKMMQEQASSRRL